MTTTIFISSVQKELAAERRALKDYIEGDPLLRRFFDVFLFEDLPASDRRADGVYLDEVDRCGIYLGMFGNEYGYEDGNGLSPTEREFDRATATGKTRLIYLTGAVDKSRQPKMAALVRKAGDQLIRKRIAGGLPDLKQAVYASLVEDLVRRGEIPDAPFEERAHKDAGFDAIDEKAVAMFIRRARDERQFPLAEETAVVDVLTHLHLLSDGRVTNAGVLLFGRDPQRFLPCAEVRCMHFHGAEVQRPVPFYRVFKGNLFEQVDQAVDFVLSKVNRSVGTRAEGTRAPVHHEIPRDMVAEAIVNAVAHRDYTSGAAIQVSVFSNRIEVWNPGELLPPLTPESLRLPHRSVLRNPRIAEALFLAHYIEKYGTGTLMMIRESREHSLPEPSFGGNQPGEFGTTVWRDWLTEEVMAELGLNDRQCAALVKAKSTGSIGNMQYREAFGVSESTALRELRNLAKIGALEKVGGTGRSAHYSAAKAKPVINPSNPSLTAKMETRHKPIKPGMPRPAVGEQGRSER